MATNKNAILRYNALDKCFSNPYKKFYVEDLIDYCSEALTEHYAKVTSVSRRQIYEDIDFIRSEAGYAAPLEAHKDGRKTYYRYSDPDFSILKTPLTTAEIEQLNLAFDTLSRLKDLAGFGWTEGLKTKLKAGLSQDHQVISFEENEFLKGVEYLSPLYQYIINKQSLQITYQSFTIETPNRFPVSPYYLKQYNNRWFLFGWNATVNKLQNLALDRILHIEADSNTYTNQNVDFEHYFEDIVGVSNPPDAEVEQIQIRLSDNIIPYIHSKPLHGSQRLNGNLLSLEVKLNYELESLILSYGENLTVLSPQKLKDKISRRVQQNHLNYK